MATAKTAEVLAWMEYIIIYRQEEKHDNWVENRFMAQIKLMHPTKSIHLPTIYYYGISLTKWVDGYLCRKGCELRWTRVIDIDMYS